MKKKSCAVAALCASLLMLKPAFPATEAVPEEDLPDEVLVMSDEEYQQKYFEELYGTVKEKAKLRPLDKQALALAQKWDKAKDAPSPVLTRTGGVSYVYGVSTPRILCRPLRVTDIQLQPGETVTGSPYIGDSVNWTILPSASGTGENLTVHVMVKPSMPDLVTNLIVHTDRRVYTFDLVSTENNWTPYVCFSYPEWEREKAWEAFNARLGRKSDTPATASATVPAPLNRNYKISGQKVIWRPLEVSDDGLKTYITFPDDIKAAEFPVFMLLRGKKMEIVNYRVAGHAMIIDRIFDRGVLVVGAGKGAEKIFITRGKTKGPVPMP